MIAKVKVNLQGKSVAADVSQHHRTRERYVLVRPDIVLRGGILNDPRCQIRIEHTHGVSEIVIEHDEGR